MKTVRDLVISSSVFWLHDKRSDQTIREPNITAHFTISFYNLKSSALTEQGVKRGD